MGHFIAAGCILEKNGNFVLVCETSGAKAKSFNLPAGGIEPGETLAACAVREGIEETGIKPQLDGLVGIYEVIVGASDYILIAIFSARTPRRSALYPKEDIVVKFFSYEEIRALDAGGRLRSPVVLIAIEDYRNGNVHPLSSFKALTIGEAPAITIRKAA